MKKCLSAVLLCGTAFAQQNARPVQQTPSVAKAPVSPVTQSLPTPQTVEMFMQRMFGQDPNIKWRIAGIAPSLIPGVAQVRVLIGEPPQATNLYVMPDQKFAFVGDVLPFGRDPFAPVRQRLSVEAKGHARGTAAAPVTIVEFADLQCPGCKAAYPVLERLLQDFPQSRLVFQHFPLANHKWAAEAATYAECAEQQSPGAFWKFVSSVYAAQSEITEADASPKLQSIAVGAGADAAKLAQCAKSPDVAARIQQSVDLARSIGVSGTPTVYVNGRRLPGIVDIPYESLKQLVEFEARMAASK